MSEEKITRYTEDELEQRRVQGVDTGTNWEKVNALSDEDIEKATEEDPDAAPFLGEEFWENASFVPSAKKVDIHLQLDPDIVEFFKQEGSNYQNHINAILRTYVDACKEHRIS